MPCKLRSDSLEADLLKSFSEGEAEAAAAAGGMAGGSCDDGSYLDTHANEGRVHTHTHQTHTHTNATPFTVNLLKPYSL